MTKKPFHHLHFSENVHLDMDATGVASITQKIMVQRVKEMDKALLGSCVEIVKDSGVTDLYLIDEDFVLNALKKHIPVDPYSSEVGYGRIAHYCPVCGNLLNVPTLEMFKNGSYCDKCGQKIKWGDCHD